VIAFFTTSGFSSSLIGGGLYAFDYSLGVFDRSCFGLVGGFIALKAPVNPYLPVTVNGFLEADIMSFVLEICVHCLSLWLM